MRAEREKEKKEKFVKDSKKKKQASKRPNKVKSKK